MTTINCICSGEAAFRAMMHEFGWAKHPMVHRIDTLRKDVPVTMMYGSRSWLDHSASQIVKEKRMDSYVKVQVRYVDCSMKITNLYTCA